VLLKRPGRLPAGDYRLQIGGGPEVGQVRVEDVPRAFAAPAPAHPQSATLGEVGKSPLVRFLGYDLTPASLRPGETVRLGLYWRAESEADDDYTVFTHLVGPDGRIYAQRDNPPAGGSRPTSGWLAGEVIDDRYELRLDDRAPAGTYKLEVGMYRPDTGARLLAGAGTSIVLDAGVQVAQTGATASPYGRVALRRVAKGDDFERRLGFQAGGVAPALS